MTFNARRLDRQLRIEDWDQEALDEAEVGVIGGTDHLDSTFILSSAALGVNSIRAVSPSLDEQFTEIAEKVNPHLDLAHVEGYVTHPSIADVFRDTDVIVDLSNYSIANKIALNDGFTNERPIVRGSYDRDQASVFTYQPGREWEELRDMLADTTFPDDSESDTAIELAVSGIALEETKELLMGGEPSDKIITYDRSRFQASEGGEDDSILVVGAGGIGNFVGPALMDAGFHNIDFLDPDEAESTNLNRQVFLYDAVGENKAETLARRMNRLYGPDDVKGRAEQMIGWRASARDEYFKEDTDISDYDAIFDCVDNFETRILMSEAAEETETVMISGGTNIDAGQVVTYDPDRDDEPPADYLDLYDLVDDEDFDVQEQEEEEGAACIYRPDPSVIMTNQIIGGLMVDSYRKIKAEGEQADTIFYDSDSAAKM